jgi:capsular exopolysaccharide synthesis family protein
MITQENFTDLENDSIYIVKELRYYAFFWPWFLTSVIVMFLSAFVYLHYTSNTYNTTATLQVRDAKSDPSSFLAQSAGSMFNFNRVKIDNYITQITSKPNLQNVVQALDLQTKIHSVGHVRNSIKYGDQIPFVIEFKTDTIYPNGINIEFVNNKPSLSFGEKQYQLMPGQTFELEDFRLALSEMPQGDSEFLITRIRNANAIAALSSSIDVIASTEEGDNIDLSIKGSSVKRNEAIINNLIEIANAKQVSEKRQIYALSIDFINSRLSSIVKEIDSLSLQTTSFKSDNLIFSAAAQTSNALSSLTDLEQEKFNLTTQLELAKSLLKNLQSQSNFSLLPSNIGINSTNVNELVLAYNTLVLERNGLLSGATQRNPIIIQLSTQLTDLKQNILSSTENYLDNLEIALSEFDEFKTTTSTKVAKIPKLEATLQAFERKFQIAENLYLFLLQKREEASISYEATLPDTRVINYAHTNPIPVSPKNKIIFLTALITGFLLPFAVLFLFKTLDTKLHTREDLQKSLPNLDILGEVPFVDDVNAITKDSRGMFAESTRVIRSNINFKLPNQTTSKVILCTSSIKGEGKTICAFNIAASYTATGKKVILLGADLRNPQLHSLLEIERDNKKGLSTSAVSENHTNFSDSIMSYKIFNNTMDILSSGPIPPNPAEILGSSKCFDIINSLKNIYDVVVIDSAPLVLVSDTLPLLKLADLVLYSVRAHYTDVKLAPFIRGLVEDKKIDNIGIVFNGIKAGGSSYYKYGYGYRYSYQSRYNYGYGYGYGE